MASKKGILLTIGILAVITAASFLIWFIPQNNELLFVVSDFESNLDNTKEIHKTLLSGIEIEFQNMLNDKITPEDYIKLAEISSSQVNSEIIQLVGSDPPEEWVESYLNYFESLKKFNDFIRETIVFANLMKTNAVEQDLENALETLDELKRESASLSIASDESRP